MPRITRIYTRGGDDGMTSLGGGQRVKKYDTRIEAFGTVDELNSTIGLALAEGIDDELSLVLHRVQNELFHLGSDLCVREDDKPTMPVPTIDQRHIDALESLLDDLSERTGPLENFILPGGSPGAARLHVARTVCRRAERLLVELADEEPIGPHTVSYLNRLSDALFAMARFENKARGIEDVYWDSRA